MTLPKGFDPPPRRPDDDEEEDKFSIRLCIGLMILALILILIGALLGMFTAASAYVETLTDEGKEMLPILRIIFVASLIIGIPMMILAYSKHRKLELTTPSEWTKMFWGDGGGDERQCTICQKHPTPKNYHIKNVHKMKNVNVNDYFTMCGCIKCTKYL